MGRKLKTIEKVHIFLARKRGKATVRTIAREVSGSVGRTSACLLKLMSLGLVEREQVRGNGTLMYWSTYKPESD